MTARASQIRLGSALLLCTPALLWTFDLLRETSALLVAAATLPAAFLVAVVLLVQRGGGRPGAALVAALAWGAAGASFLASAGNELARDAMNALAGDAARAVTAVLVAPALEEGAKALGLLLLVVLAPACLRSVRDGLVYGALIGIGFVWTENFLYLGVSMLQGGPEGLLRGLYLRGIVGGVAHLTFTACSGATLGWWRSGRPSRLATRAGPSSGFLVAVAQHIAWNSLAAPTIATALCGASGPNGSCVDQPTNLTLFGVVTLVALVFLGPGLVAATLAWWSGKDDGPTDSPRAGRAAA